MKFLEPGVEGGNPFSHRYNEYFFSIYKHIIIIIFQDSCRHVAPETESFSVCMCLHGDVNFTQRIFAALIPTNAFLFLAYFSPVASMTIYFYLFVKFAASWNESMSC